MSMYGEKTFEAKCNDCGIEYKITYNADDFVHPDCCAGCGSDTEIRMEEVK